MPPPNPLAGEIQNFTRSDWQELVKSTSPGTITSTDRDGDAVLVGLINAEKIVGCARFCLGYMRANPDANKYRLERFDPVLHPYAGGISLNPGGGGYGMGWYCTGADFQPFAPTGRGLGLLQGILANPKGPDLRGYAQYKKSYVTLRFKPLTWDFGEDPSDGSPSQYEYTRYIEWSAPTTQLQAVGASGFQLKFAAGPLYNAGNPAASTAYPADFFDTQPKLAVNLLWRRVPHPYLFNNTGIPQKILSGLGKVNLELFSGYPPGVMLLNTVTFGQYPWPWRVGTEHRWQYDVRFEFLVFDPPNGASSAWGWTGTASTERGHNLMPSPVIPGTVPSSGNLGVPYYPARRVDQAGAPTVVPLIGRYDYTKFFEHVDKP